MFRWFASALGCLTAVALGYTVVLQTGIDVAHSPENTDFSLPLERDDSSTGQLADARVPPVGKQPVLAQPQNTSRPAQTRPDVKPALVAQPQQQRWTWSVTKSDAVSVPVGTYDAASAAQLTRRIQRAIQRAGCGKVYVTGYWDQRTRHAVAAFLSNTNASLPVTHPDPALLSMLTNYRGDNCGRRCIGTHCSASEVARAQPSVKLIRPPALASRSTNTTVVSGWTTTVAPTTPNLLPAPVPRIASRPVARKATRTLPAQQPAQLHNGFGVQTSTFGGSRMALGARPVDQSGASSTYQSVTTSPVQPYIQGEQDQPDAITGAAAHRAAQIRRELQRDRRRNAKRASRNKRRSVRRRRRGNWRAQAFSPRD